MKKEVEMNKNIFFRMWVGAFAACCMTHASASYITCALNTDCQFTNYWESIYIPITEKADYKCHFKQVNITDRNVMHEICINRILHFQLGGSYGYEVNRYITSDQPGLLWGFSISVKRTNFHFSYLPLPEAAKITVNCQKI